VDFSDEQKLRAGIADEMLDYTVLPSSCDTFYLHVSLRRVCIPQDFVLSHVHAGDQASILSGMEETITRYCIDKISLLRSLAHINRVQKV
jgi:hypothetical protein